MTSQLSVEQGSWVLVTGANGFIGTHVVEQLLGRGYKVRGTVRDATKSAWLTGELFRNEAANGFLEVIEVKDMAAEDAFKAAVRDVSAIVHVATISSWSPDPHAVIPQTVAGVINLLKAAHQEPSVKTFVYTSTVGAATMAMADTPHHVAEESWNDAVVDMAWAPPPYDGNRFLLTYIASKVGAEKALWKFVEDQKPAFVVNSVLPFTTFGPMLHPSQNPSTDTMVFGLYNGDTSALLPAQALAYVHVRDVALLHVAALLDTTVKHRRVHAWSAPFNYNDILTILRKLHPEKKFIDDRDGMGKMLATVDDSLGRELLRRWGKDRRQGEEWIGFEQGIRDTIEGKWPVTSLN